MRLGCGLRGSRWLLAVRPGCTGRLHRGERTVECLSVRAPVRSRRDEPSWVAASRVAYVSDSGEEAEACRWTTPAETSGRPRMKPAIFASLRIGAESIDSITAECLQWAIVIGDCGPYLNFN